MSDSMPCFGVALGDRDRLSLHSGGINWVLGGGSRRGGAIRCRCRR